MFARGSRNPRRTAALWRTLRKQAELIRLPCVDAELARVVCDLAVGNAMAVTLLDDVIDLSADLPRYRRLAAGYRDALCGEPDTDLPAAEPEWLALRAIGRSLHARLAAMPRFAELAPLVAFDLDQVIAAMHYHHLVRAHRLRCQREYLETYHGNSITVVWIKTMELCASPTFDHAELSTLREAARHVQQIFVHVADRTTWRSELAAGEDHPGIATQAIVRRLMTWEELDALRAQPAALGERIASCGVLPAIAADVEAHFAALRTEVARLRSVDLAGWPEQVAALVRVQEAAIDHV
jgi:hypothetical protein